MCSALPVARHARQGLKARDLQDQVAWRLTPTPPVRERRYLRQRDAHVLGPTGFLEEGLVLFHGRLEVEDQGLVVAADQPPGHDDVPLVRAEHLEAGAGPGAPPRYRPWRTA